MTFLYLILLYISPTQKIWASIPDVSLDRPPFWQRNNKAYTKVTEERAILVSVVATQEDQPLKKLEMQGVGLVNLDSARSFEIAKDLESLQNFSEFIKRVKFDRPKNWVEIYSEAFGYKAFMGMNVEFTSQPMRQIKFLIEKGVFAGMKGTIRFKDYKRRKTEVQFLSTYNFQKLPVPQFFVEFGLEVIIQKVAAKMRTHIESKKLSTGAL